MHPPSEAVEISHLSGASGVSESLEMETEALEMCDSFLRQYYIHRRSSPPKLPQQAPIGGFSLPIGCIVVPVWGLYFGFYKV